MPKPKERPILFNGDMVRAILAGEKTQTRRQVKPPRGYEINKYLGEREDRDIATLYHWFEMNLSSEAGLLCPYGQPGGRLWVKETSWVCIDNNDTPLPVADGPAPTTECRHYKKRSSIHMPRWESRITLEITDVRVQRLQEISEEDALAEGAHYADTGDNRSLPCWSMLRPHPNSHALCLATARMSFANFVNRLHGGPNWNLKPNDLWTQNPFVWAITFKLVEE